MDGFFASLADSRFSKPAALGRTPTCCPYCPMTKHCHWRKNGTYPRYGLGQERIRIQVWECLITRRTFSLLPDALLPYQQTTTECMLRCLHSMVISGRGAASTARTFRLHRNTARSIREKFYRAVKILRLPGHAGALDPVAFLRRLAALSLNAVADLFSSWKELEPKHSLAGFHPR